MTTVTDEDFDFALRLDSMSLLSGVPAVLNCVAVAAARHREAAEARAFEAGAKAMQEAAEHVMMAWGASGRSSHQSPASAIATLDPAQIAGDGE